MDPQTAALARSVRRFLETVQAELDHSGEELTPLGRTVQEFLGVELSAVEPITEQFPPHQAVDLDLALESLLAAHDGRLLGVAGPDRAHLESITDFLRYSHFRFAPGPVSYIRMPTGPGRDRRVVAFGLGLLQLDHVPLVVLVRAANPRYGREFVTLEVLCPTASTSETFLAGVRRRMAEQSILRGQVVSFSRNDFDYHAPGGALTFLGRPEVGADQVILPDGLLERVTRHVVGIGQRSDQLRAAGQHTKRGVLLYGPPGTGKTHLVRHLLTATPDTTAVLLSGKSL
ncbi:MAG: AAA family ATPase, partial [Actinomycetes bacterium]